MANTERVNSRRRFIRQALTLTGAAVGTALLAGCSREQPCSEQVIIKGKQPVYTDESDQVTAAAYTDNPLVPYLGGEFIEAINPDRAFHGFTDRVDHQSGMIIIVNDVIDPATSTIKVRGSLDTPQGGHSEWSYTEPIDPVKCNKTSMRWKIGRVVEALLNDQRPASLKITP